MFPPTTLLQYPITRFSRRHNVHPESSLTSEGSVVSLVGLLLRIGPEDPGKPALQRWHATPAFDLPMAGIEPTASQETPPWWVKPGDASRSSGGSNSGPPTESPEPLPLGQAIICIHN
ncbi:hypothetical protein LXL04_030405 [Taraxacum kok-saghyz]